MHIATQPYAASPAHREALARIKSGLPMFGFATRNRVALRARQALLRELHAAGLVEQGPAGPEITAAGNAALAFLRALRADETMDARQVMAATGVPRSTLYYLIARDRFPRQIAKGLWLADAVERWKIEKSSSR